MAQYLSPSGDDDGPGVFLTGIRAKAGKRARISLLAVLALGSVAFAPDVALADCTVTQAGGVTCNANTVTTATTLLDAGGLPSTTSSDRILQWDNGTAITAAINAVTINGYGLELLQTGATSGTIDIVNNAGSTIESDLGNGTPALALIGNSGKITYSGSGSIIGNDQAGIYATNTGTGQISIVTSGIISAGDNSGGDDYGIYTSAQNGATTIDLTGGTIQGATSGGLADGAGIYSRSASGNVTITANNIGADSSDRTYTGIDAAITGNGSGALSVTSLGTVYATQTGISAVNNNLGGITVNLNSGSTLDVSGGTATVGEYVRDTGSAGGITINNQAGSLIDPDIGVDSQITNNANSGNVIVHQNGGITATDTGIIAATNGTGNITVDGSGAIVGGSGAFALSTTSPVTADNAGIVAIQDGTSGGVTVGGSGTTSANGAITAEITDASNGSAILVNRSGAISVTGTDGFGINAITQGTGTVTVMNTGTIAGSGGGTVAFGINASGQGGNVLVSNVGGITANGTDGYGIAASTINNGTVTVSGTGAITANGNGISATTTGTGNVIVTGTGAIVADNDTSGSGTGIIATSVGGNITVTPGSTVSGANGIDAETANNGTVTVTTSAGDVSGTGGYGVKTVAQNGATIVTNNINDITGSTDGVNSSSVNGKITITGSGSIGGGSGAGIVATMTGATGTGAGTDGILISGTGSVNTTGAGDGIDASITSAGNHSNITVNRSGTVTAGNNGILATTLGDGDVTVINTGNVRATTGTGIDGESQGGDILISPSGTVSDASGIYGSTNASGTVTITTAFGASGNVTGSAGFGIGSSAENGNTYITNNASLVQGSTYASTSTTSGTGGISVVGAGDFTGGSAGGIYAIILGTGPSGASGVGPGGTNGIYISGSGKATTTDGDAIHAFESGGTANILVNRTGLVTVTDTVGGGDGIYAVTNGSGNVTVTSVTGVSAGQGATAIGIDAESNGGNIIVTPAGTVSGGNGVKATTNGSGTVLVQTIVGASGNISGLDGYGVLTSAQDGNTIVNNRAAQISGTTWADNSTSTGLGTLTIEGAGNYAGGMGGGIGAYMTGIGPAAGNTGIYITGSGNTSATTGSGIHAEISNPANESDIVIDRTGTVIVSNAAGGDGIYAHTAGDGNVLIHDVSNVQAGTGGTAHGIDAASNGGDVTVDLSTPLLNSATVSGGNGISAVTTNGGDVTVTTYTGAAGNVTGLAGYGVNTSAADGDTVVTNNATNISGTTWADQSTVSGFGTIRITDSGVAGNGNFVGGSSGGIYAYANGAGPGAGSGIGPDDAAIWISGSGNTSGTAGYGIYAVIDNPLNANSILIDRTGTVTDTGGSGIYAAITSGGTGNVTVTGTGAVIADDTGIGTGITALAQTGDVTVTPASTVYGSAGIDAETAGPGTVTVTTLGDITGTIGDGIHARSADGDINVTTAAGTTVAGDTSMTGSGDGIDAQASGAGNVHVIANSDVYGDPAIIVTSATGNAWATANGTTTGLTYGVYAEVTSAAATSFVLVDGTGNVTGGTTGIYANNNGSGTTTVTGSGNTIGQGADGIDAFSVAGDVLVNKTGTVTGWGNGIDADSTGGGNVTVDGVGDVLANTGGGTATGIIAASSGGDGDVQVTPAGTVTGYRGIYASADGLGTVTVTTASGAAGNVTGTGSSGIETIANNGDTTVTNNAALVSGATFGVTSLSSGTGAITIDGPGTYHGGTDAGISAQANGAGPGTGLTGIHITGSGDATTDTGVGIYANITNVANDSNILIDRTGTVTVGANGGDGIDATTSGTGDITIDGVGDVLAGTVNPTTGIYAEAALGGNVDIEPNGTVTGSDTGIYGRAHVAGNVTVVTASGAAGNVTGTNGDGIHAMTHDGNITVTNNADLVMGGVTGAHAVVTGAGSITIDGSGTYTGTTGYGIRAYESSTGPGAGNNGIHISGSGDTTTTSGTGISAVINSGSNASDILIDRTGAVTVGAGGLDGIDATTAGIGNVTITGTGAVTAGTGSLMTGILAYASGGNVDVEPASTVYGGGVGIDAETFGTGTVTVTTVGDITGDANDGIRAVSTDGDITVTTAADTIVTGDALGTGNGDGIDARAGGAGNVRVLANSDVYGDPGIISTSITGNVWATANGTTVGTVAEGVYAEVTGSSATSYVLVDGAGNVTGATNGIYANNNGSGDTTVSGSGNTEGQNGDGIEAYSVAGDVLVNRTGTVSGTVTGIDAESTGGGDVTVTGTGNVLGDTSGGSYDGIHAAATGGNGNVSVTPAGTVDGDTGIATSAAGTGTITVTTASGAGGNVTGHAGDGIDATAHDGNIDVTNNAALVSGTAAGTSDVTDGIGAITVGGAGTYHGGTGDGIDAIEFGDGPALGAGVSPSTNAGIWITGSGDTTSDTGNGIYAYIASVSNVSDIVIDRSGAVTVGAGGGDGIVAQTNGSGNISITGTGPVTAGTGSGTTGIQAIASGGNVDVEPASSVHGGKYGIDAETTGTGTVTVVTHGDITGDTDDAIHARSVDGNISVTTAAGTTVRGDALGTGFGDGIDARASGAGNVHVIANSAVYGDPAIIVTSATGNAWATANGITTGLTYGVYAQVTGTSATSYVLVDGSGNVTGGTIGIYADNDGHGTTTVSGSGNTAGNGGDGIDAYATDGAVLVNRTGTVTATKIGIDAETSAGGSVTVTGTGNVTANTSGVGYAGIRAIQSGGNGNVSVTPAGTVSGGLGIYAQAAGTGTVTVTTASGAGGNVTGTQGNGIDAVGIDGNVTVTNNAATVLGALTGVYAESDGLGAISVTGSGTYTGTSNYGIDAVMLGTGPAAGNNGISIAGTGNASTTSGTGIYAFIDNASNVSNISITRSGTVTVGAGGSDGVHANTIGGGSVTITGTGNVVAGTSATGIYATTSGGNGSVTITPNGTISGARGIYASAIGTGTVTVTVTHNTAGNAGNGIETAGVNGATNVNVNGGTTTGTGTGKAGVNETGTGSGSLNLTVASGATVTGGSTASGVRMSQSGSGANSITNSGTIIGAGTSANPVIAIGAASGTSTITNNSGATIHSNSATASQPADLAILSTTTTGADSIFNHGTLNGEIKLSNASNLMNNSGIWNVRDNTSTLLLAAAFGSSGSNTLINSGTINAGNATAASASTFTGVQTFTNSGTVNAGLNGTGDVTTFDASGHVQTVTNTGTFNVHGTLNFIGDATFYNAGGIIDMRTSGSAVTDVTGLNVTASGNTYSPGVAYDFAGGTNSRLGVDTNVGALSSAGSTVPSDRLLISGDATSTTGILVNDTNAGFGSYNPVGITLVGVNGTSSDAFTLQSLTSTSPYDVLETGVGPMGAIKKGFFFYPLLQSMHAEAVADGLTGANSTEYRLYGLPDVEAYQLPLAITGAENIWYETAEGWDERQEEARRYWDVYADRRTKSSGKMADVWLKGTGSWTKRDVSFDPSALVPAASVLDPISTDFKQNVASIQLGVDGQVGGTRDGAFVLGGSVGYVGSSLDFEGTHNTFDYSGGIIDATADYYNGPWFVDVLAKVDLLRTTLKFNSLDAFGYTNKTTNSDTYGALSTAGYHFVLDRGHSGHTYLEPLLSLTYTQTNMDKVALLGTDIDFDSGKTFRGGIGARLGTLMGEKQSFYLDGSITGQYWDEFTNSTNVILSTMGPALSLNDEGRKKGFGQVTGMLDIADGNSGWSGFINGGAKFNSEFTTVELKGGVRYQW